MSTTFQLQLTALLARARTEQWPHEMLAATVAELHRQHGLQVPPPITGTVTIAEPMDTFAPPRKT
jgi:hypothetical protein